MLINGSSRKIIILYDSGRKHFDDDILHEIIIPPSPIFFIGIILV